MNLPRMAGAAFGGLAAGLGLSAAMLVGEHLSGKPSELLELERKAAAKLGATMPHGKSRATLREQVITHGGHLALSALVGIAYAAIVKRGEDDATSGAVFGIGFFVAAYGLAGPLLDVTPWPWRQPPLRAVQHPLVHILFGIAMALSARKSVRTRPAALP